MRSLKVAAKALSLLYIGIFVGDVYSWLSCQWTYRMPISIQETSGNTLINYPVNISIDTATLISEGKMKSDCSDIRFSYVYPDGTEIEIPYWIGSGCNTANTEILVNVPEIPANSIVTIYMYYGNPGAASASDLYSVCPSGIIAGYCAEFGDTFDSNTLDGGKWPGIVNGALGRDVVVGQYCRTESGNVLVTRWDDSEILSTSLDFSDRTPRILRYWAEQGSDFDPFQCENPDSGEDLFIDYLDNSGTWQTLSSHLGSGSDPPEGVGVEYILDLPPSAYHSNFQIKIRRVGGSGQDFDYWVIDNLVIAKKPGLVTYTLGTEESILVKGFNLIEPPNGTVVTTDTPTINVSLIRDNYACSVSCNLQTSYPTAQTFTMQVSPDNSYCSINLDLNGLVQQDGRLDYYITSTVGGITVNSDIYTLYVPTENIVNITSPANNTIINGNILIEASSNSILDITSCTIETNIGNFTGTVVSENVCQATLDLTNACPDVLWYRVWMENSAGVSNVSEWYFADNDFIYNIQISPANASTINSDIVTITATFEKACNADVEGIIIFTYPTYIEDNMTCSGNKCTYDLDLNYFVQADGKVQYKIRIIHPNEIEETDLYEFYVPVQHTVSIIEPEIGDPVLGSGFKVVAKSDSILKIDSCYPILPQGATFENLVIDQERRTCEFFVNLENYCSSNTIDIAVVLQNTAGVNATSSTQSHLIYDPQINVQFTDRVPLNSTNVRYLPIEVQVNKVLLGGVYVPTTKKFVYEIQGSNTTIYGNDDGVALLELFHPNITNILGTKDAGTISVKVYGIGRCSNVNSTELRNISIPETVFDVDFVSPPTPPDGDTLSIKFMEIQGQINENILANVQCTLEISKDDGFTWIPIKSMENCYAYLVNDELDTPLGFLLYRINITDTKWGETNLSIVRRVNIPSNASPILTVNSGMSPDTVQQTINSAIANGDPAVLFQTGTYYLNLVIDPQGHDIRLLGTGSIIKPHSKGFPVFTIRSGNVTLENFIISDALFNIKVTGGYAKIKDTVIKGGLYGVQAQNAKVDIEDSILDTKLAGVYIENADNINIIDSYLRGKVWGAYFRNSNNTLIDPSTIEGKVFGIHFAGNSYNNIIVNSTIRAKVFGILIDGGSNNTIKNSSIYAQVFGIKIPGGNIVEDVIIDGVKVFGLYSTQPNTIKNIIIKQAKVFGLYITGDAYNVTIYNSKLGSNLMGSGKIDYFTLGDTTVNLSYSGSIMAMQDDPTKHPEGVVYTGQAIKILGSGQANITFIYDNPAYTQYYIYKLLGSLAELVASGKYIEANNIGTYALYGK